MRDNNRATRAMAATALFLLAACGADTDATAPAAPRPQFPQTCQLEPETEHAAQLLAAMNAKDATAIAAATAAVRAAFVDPKPEVRTRFNFPEDRAEDFSFTDADFARINSAYLQLARGSSWWRNERPAENTPYPLQRPAQLIRGLVAFAETHPERRDDALALAHEAGAYLVAASAEAQFPGAPLPYWRNKSGRLGEIADAMALTMEECGGLDLAVVNGWFVADPLAHAYFRDTGRVGEALIALNAIDPRKEYKDWNAAAIAWEKEQPLAVDFHQNAFIILHLAQAAITSGDDAHLDHALERATFGVLPGLVTEGDGVGHFIDPRNERFDHRAIMARSLIRLSHALAKHDAIGESEDRQKIVDSADSMLAALEAEMVAADGAASPDAMVEIYLDFDAARAAGAPLAENNADARKLVFSTADKTVASGRFNLSAATGRYLSYLKSNPAGSE